MDFSQLHKCDTPSTCSLDASQKTFNEESVSLETEIPEVLYNGMKEFIVRNPNWDKFSVMTSALATFLFQNGSNDRAVSERYLNDLFKI